MLKSIFFLLLSVLPAKASALSLLNLETEARALALDNGIRLRFSTSTIDTFLNEGQRIMVTSLRLEPPTTLSRATSCK